MAKGILETIEVDPVRVGRVTVWLKGTTPMICNCMSAKVRRALLCPSGRKGKAEREQSLKHDPLAEYRDSMKKRAGDGPTRILVPAPAPKGAMAEAAKETKGTNAKQIGRLVNAVGTDCDLYGVPQMFMSVVRSADINHTPDIRTRALLPEWCMQVTLLFVKPQLSEKSILQLLCNAGVIIGLGDFRPEKGKGNYGQFEVVTEADCKSIIKSGGMKQQDAAIRDPKCYDADTEELFSWFDSEVDRRGKKDMLAA